MTDNPRVAELVHMAVGLDRIAAAMEPVSTYVEGVRDGHRECAELLRNRARILAGASVDTPVESL